MVVVVHGIGGHGGQFDGVAAHLVPRGYDVYAPDLPGHGRSPGPRGWIPTWEAFRGSVAALLDHIEPAGSTSQPPVLVGHSLGGTVAVDLALHEPARVRGVILSNPATGAEGVAPWRLLVARSLSGLWPRFALETGIPMDALSRDPQALARLAADPLRHGRCTARLGTEFLTAAERIRRQAGQLTTPLLVLQSSADTITPPEAARSFFQAVGATDKIWRFYPESYHELFDDLDREQVLADIVAWLEAHGG
ncbi:MAG TPA: alpha/beta hydrolase [Cyanobium sp.]|nr:alpha/beta hydrolase [Cyanobium sp.]